MIQSKIKPRSKPEKYHSKSNVLPLTLMYAVLIAWALTTVLPFLWVIMNSFKDRELIVADAFSFPSPVTLDNYLEAFRRQNIGLAYFNSLYISGIVTLAVMVIASLAAFGLVRYRFKGSQILRMLVVGSLMFPAFSTIIPVFRIVQTINLLNTRWAVILPQIAGNTAFAMVILMGYIRGLPVDLEESAFLEGCNAFQVFWKIVIPISRPALATVSIFTFLWSYNDLFLQLFFLNKKALKPVTRLLNEISSLEGGTNYGLMAAAVSLVVVPVLIVYMFMQKNIIKGLTAGAVKG